MLDEISVASSVLGSRGMSYSPFMTIGEGGMAQVHLAKASGPSGFEKLVVLKTIRRNALSNPRIRELFVDEARLCAQLNHPNLVQVHDVDLETASPCLVMEYLEGKTLHDVQLAGALDRRMLLAVISEILAGLHYAHELTSFDGRLMNVVHRDMSPQNVFLTYDGTAKVLDFGIAKMAGATSDTATEAVRGKLSYIAPEQLLGSGVDRRTDIFAVGVMLWECVVGRRMWEGVAEPAIMHRLANGDIPEVPVQAEVTQPLIDLIRKATAADPSDRYRTAHEFGAALDAYLASSGRRPPMRVVGQALSDVFAEDREQKAESIRRALLELTRAPAPHPSDAQSQAPTLDEHLTAQDEKDPARRGAYVLAAAVLLTVLAVGWVLLAPLRGKEGASEAVSPETRNRTVTGAAPSAGEALAINGDEPSSGEKDAPQLGQAAAPEEAFSAPQVTSTKPIVDQVIRKKAPGRPSQVTRTAAPATTPTGTPATGSSPTARPDCETPYFYQNGIKSYRPECL